MKRIRTKQVCQWITNRQQRFLLLLILSLLTLPFHLHLNIWITGIFVINAIFSARAKEFENDSSVLQAYTLVALLGLLNVLSLFYTENISVGASKIETKIWLVMMPLAFFLGLNKLTLPQLIKAKRAFLIAILVATVSCYVESSYQALVHGQLSSLFNSRLSNHLMIHRAYFSSFLVIALLMWWEDKEFLPLVRKFSLFLFPVALLMLQGRINIIALGIVAVVYLLITEIRKRSPTRLAVVGITIVGLLTFFSRAPYDYNRFDEPLTTSFNLEDREDDFTGLTFRLAIWKNASEVLSKNWMGYGIGDVQAVLTDQYASRNFKVGVKREPNCHNQFLESTIAIGILGPLVLLLLLFVVLRRSIQLKAPFMAMMTIAYYITMLTESVLNRYHGVMILGLVLLLYYKCIIKELEQTHEMRD